MDSFTQIVLGAACGEAVAGKKLGNRAMMWGAIGGTIPDLDVFAVFFTDDISSLAFHRGFMHSFLFAALAPWLLALLTVWFYKRDVHRRRSYKAVAMGMWIIFFLMAAAGINFIPVMMGGGISYYTLLPTLLLGGWFIWKLWRDYWRRDLPIVELPYRSWIALFFWSIFTHPILDCFTSYGTQIWQPFNDLRVQWSTVSVVDPAATLPFALLLLIAAQFRKNAPKRMLFNWLGLGWFCWYLFIYTVGHKMTANRLFEQSMKTNNITYSRYYTNPTLFNNIVWYGVAEGDTAYYYSMYGFNDPVQEFTKISTLPKNHGLLNHIPEDDRAYHFLRWFSNGYYNVTAQNGDTLHVNDLRFGLLGDTLQNDNYVFPFLLYKNDRGEWNVKQKNRSRKGMRDSDRSFKDLWKRVKGE